MYIDGTTSSSGLARLIAGRLAMPHADLAEPVPGLCALLAARPSSGLGLSELTERLLRGDSALGEDERELIAAYVAYLGQAPLRAGGRPGTGVGARVGDRMRALLPIARKVHADPLTVTTQDVADARAAGVDDTAIHDTVLISSGHVHVPPLWGGTRRPAAARSHTSTCRRAGSSRHRVVCSRRAVDHLKSARTKKPCRSVRCQDRHLEISSAGAGCRIGDGPHSLPLPEHAFPGRRTILGHRLMPTEGNTC
ncbi:hypothetical protein EES41_40870 (plasmid) [Streptomyces sp. ADI95-16]|uniref:hypothetical protein n=1 Tax=Streptomyces sp. ADI95-16 TaxID=1522758 RepID=UPI000F436F93|nr:hypothetical protein [Streptomyces sp. ADI95-16]AYV33132.1 hypothetical protein EES41_40870 [Streptomyces sp. ADI95-16]